MFNFKERQSFFPVLLYPFLLVIYFMLHENNDNYGLIPIGYTFEQLAIYLGISLIISLLSWYLFKSAGKMFLFTVLMISILLFFGAFHDAIKRWPVPDFFTRYTFLLSFLLFFVVAAIVFFKRTHRPFIHSGRYIAIILVILCIWETAALAINMISAKENSNILFSKNDRNTSLINQGGTNHPNIYFIVFDAFTSSKCLKEEFGYDNASLDSFLHQQGFYTVANSKSNYQNTPFSIASTLNYSYLVPELGHQVSAKSMVQGQETVAHNRFIPFLEKNGYTIYNHSVFDLPGHSTTGYTYFGYMEKGLLTRQTLWGRITRDILWNFKHLNLFTFRRDDNKARAEGISGYLRVFVTVNLEALQRSIKSNTKSPKFVYCHIMLPHEPFYLNRDGSWVQPGTDRTLKQQYLEQLIYTGSIARSVITTIFEKDPANKIVILEGDHGFRNYEEPDKTARHFQNLNAIYFYDRNYTALYDSISPVNTFRVVLNQYFGQRLPYLKDTSIFVKDVNVFKAGKDRFQ